MKEDKITTVKIVRNRDDFFAFCQQVTKPLIYLRVAYILAVLALVIVFIYASSFLLNHHLIPMILLSSVLAFPICVFFAMLLCLMIIKKCFMPAMKRTYMNEDQAFLRPKQVTIDEAGFHETSDLSDGFVAWKGVDRLEKSQKFLLVYVDRMSAFCIPIRNFDTPHHAEQFYENMMEYWCAANGRHM